MSEEMNRGLYVKYEVRKKDTGELVDGCFVLRPDRDPAAREALLAYANATSNKQLAIEIVDWLLEMERREKDESSTAF